MCLKSSNIVLLNHADAKAFLEGELKTPEFKAFCTQMAEIKIAVDSKRKEAGIESTDKIFTTRSLATPVNEGENETNNAEESVSTYIQAINTMTMHAAVMNQAPTVGKNLSKQLPMLQEHLNTAKANANNWQNDVRPELSKIVTDFIDSSNTWETYVEYMSDQAQDAKNRTRKATTQAEKDEILNDLKSDLADISAELQDDVGDKQTTIESAVMKLGSLIKLLNLDVANFSKDNKDAEALIGTKENPGLLDEMDKAIAAQQTRVNRDIGLIVGGSIAVVGAAIGGVAIIVATGGIGTGFGIALGAVALGGAGAITVGAVDLQNAYKDLENALTTKTETEQDAILLKSNKTSIETYRNSATSAASSLLVIEGTWRSFGDLLANFSQKIQKASDADSVISEMIQLRVATKSLQDVKKFALDNLVPQVGVMTYEEALEKIKTKNGTKERALVLPPKKDSFLPKYIGFSLGSNSRSHIPSPNKADSNNARSRSAKGPLSFSREIRTETTNGGTNDTPKYNVLSPNFGEVNVTPMTSNALQLTAVGIGIDQQERLYVEEIPSFVENQQSQIKNAQTAFATIAPMYRTALVDIQDFSNTFDAIAEATKSEDTTIEELSPFLMITLDQVKTKFEDLKTKIKALQESQKTVLDKLEINLIEARTKLIDPQGKVSQLNSQMDGIRDSLDITNGKIADTLLRQGLTTFIDDLGLAVGWGLTSYTTSAADFGPAQKWDHKKQAVGQLSGMGDSARNIPEISEFTKTAKELLRQYGQAIIAMIISQSNYAAISDAHRSGRSMLSKLSGLLFYIGRFISKLQLLKDRMSFAFKDVEGSPEALTTKIDEANKSWSEIKKLVQAAQRLSALNQVPTTFIDYTKQEILLKVSNDENYRVPPQSPRSVAPLKTFTVDSPINDAKSEAVDVVEYCKAFKATKTDPNDLTAIKAALTNFVDGLRDRQAKMKTTETALQQETHDLNLKVSQLQGDLNHLQAQISASQQMIDGLNNKLVSEQREYRTKKMIFDALVIPTFGLSKLVEALEEAISQTKAHIRQEMNQMHSIQSKLNQQNIQYEQATRDLANATVAANYAQTVYYKLGSTIDLTSNAMKDKPSSIGKVAYSIALKGADDIIVFASNF